MKAWTGFGSALATKRLQAVEQRKAEIYALAVHASGSTEARVNSHAKGNPERPLGWRVSVTVWHGPDRLSELICVVETIKPDELVALEALKYALALGAGQP